MNSGLLLIDKPSGLTSFAVVRRARKMLKVRKVGHLGTLDPFATGLLPLCLGEATKLTPFLMGEPKTYRATLKLGEETDTQDLTGEIVAKSEELPAAAEIHQVALRFVGELMQVPPMYSAVHHQGERLYKLARRGEQVVREPRQVIIHELEVEEVALPLVTIRVTCSTGTYIRTLAADLGVALGCGAHLTTLRRLAVGSFKLEAALPLDGLAEMVSLGKLAERLISLADCLPRLRPLEVGPGEAQRLKQGQAVPCPENGLGEAEQVKVLAGGELIAVAMVRRDSQGSRIAPTRVFARTV
ncbi:MAG: tRNA pseudouridine(55) synthase TruB [Thermodesulfobacteriota bacterium]